MRILQQMQQEVMLPVPIPAPEFGTGLDIEPFQFDSGTPAQKHLKFVVIRTQNIRFGDKRNRNQNTLNILEKAKYRASICAVFCVSTPSGTVPSLSTFDP